MRSLAFITLFLAAGAASAGEDQIQLKEAPGRDLVRRNCATCHSLDYIPMNSPFLDKAGWEATVNKMIKVMGAPIVATDKDAIADYLTANYGKRP